MTAYQNYKWLMDFTERLINHVSHWVRPPVSETSAYQVQ